MVEPSREDVSVTRHGRNQICAAAPVLQPTAGVVPDLICNDPKVHVDHQSNTTNQQTAHQDRTEATRRTRRADRRAGSGISRKSQSP
jgi:hypothetical protein